MENNQQSFWQFSDQLRVQTNNLANLSLNDSIWSNSYVSKKPERRNFDIRVGGALNSVDSSKAKETDVNGYWSLHNRIGVELDSVNSSNAFKVKESDFNRNFDIRVGGELNSGIFSNTFKGKEADFNGFDHGLRTGGLNLNGYNVDLKSGLNTGFNKGIYSKPSIDYNLENSRNPNVSLNVNTKGFHKKGEDFTNHNNNLGAKTGKKNKNKDSNKESENNKDNNNSANKRFKTLPPSESLPRNETVGGYIFVCNNDTMQENLQRELFGLPPRYRDSVRAITPGLPLFLYNYSTHQLHGIYEASSFGGANIDPTAWEDKKNPGESRFPAQVRVMTRKICDPLEEDSFRPILHHYDGPKFRLELNIPEALSLLDKFSEN